MTLYWWTHWFWITLFYVHFLHSVETYPLSPSLGTDTKENNHNFHLSDKKGSKLSETIRLNFESDDDVEDVVNGRSEIQNQEEVVDRSSTVKSDSVLVQNISQSHLELEDTKQSKTEVVEVTTLAKVDRDVNRSVMPKEIDLSLAKNSSNFNHTSSQNITTTSPPHSSSANSSLESTSGTNFTTTTNKTQMSTISKNSTPSELDVEVDGLHRVPFTLENVNREEELIRAESEHRSRKSKVLSAEYRHESNFINFTSDAKNLLAIRSAGVPLGFDEQDEGNVSSEALSVQRAYFLDAGTISGICLAVLALCCGIAFTGVLVYRRRYLNKPQTLSEPDSSVYIDDSTIRDNSDEMYSLDNDSFLNSLEAMTIQNYWTDTVKHTKL